MVLAVGEHNEDPLKAPIDRWVEVVGVRKNAIIGLPRLSASELIPLPPTSGKGIVDDPLMMSQVLPLADLLLSTSLTNLSCKWWIVM